jgi:ABC-type transporter Mla subunit MlaD
MAPQRRRNWLALIVLLGLAVSLGTVGCTGGNGKKGGPGTTTGSYTVTVTGTSGSLNVPLSTVQVTIQ